MPYVYILKCRGGTFYTGWAKDVFRRFDAHRNGKGARYTKSHLPVKLVYYERKRSRRGAMLREIAIKRMTRKGKKALVKGFKKAKRPAVQA